MCKEAILNISDFIQYLHTVCYLIYQKFPVT